MTRYFSVPGAPKGKGRPKFSKVGNFVRTYTPKDTVEYENLVKMAYSERYSLEEPLKGMVEATIVAYYPIPKSMTKKNRKLIDEGKLAPTMKPDTDNIAKTILDSLNQIAYDDDKQVVTLTVSKKYSEKPRVDVYLSEFE